ncbi:MAG: redoxin domain-containing protein [Halobacteriaceae archaeon]
MVREGDAAPDFTAPLAHDDDEVTPFTLSDHLDEAPLVLAFFPGAFTGPCTSEMNTWESRLDELDAEDASIYGVSVDTPFALNEFRDVEGISFGLVSDTNKEIIDAYDVEIDFADMGYYGVANRAIFVLDADGVVQYAWEADEPGTEPDYDEVIDALADI